MASASSYYYDLNLTFRCPDLVRFQLFYFVFSQSTKITTLKC